MAKHPSFTKLQQQWYYEESLARRRISDFEHRHKVSIPDLIGTRPSRVTNQAIERLRSITAESFTLENGHLILTPEQLRMAQSAGAQAPQETDMVLTEIDRMISSMYNDSPANREYAKLIRTAFDKAIAERGRPAVAETARQQSLLEEVRIIMGYQDVDRKRQRLTGFLNALFARPLSAEEFEMFSDRFSDAQEEDEADSYEQTVSDKRAGYISAFKAERREASAKSKLEAKARKLVSMYGITKDSPEYKTVYDAVLYTLIETHGDINSGKTEIKKILEDEE